MQENIINPINPTDETSISCFKTCKTCKKMFSIISEYKMHIKEHRKVCEIIFKCICMYTLYIYFFQFDSVLKKQYKFSMKFKKKHKTANLIKKFKCDRCDWSFNKSNLLYRHMRTHTGEKPFEVSFNF